MEEAVLRKLSIKSVRTALKEAEGIKSEEEEDKCFNDHTNKCKRLKKSMNSESFEVQKDFLKNNTP